MTAQADVPMPSRVCRRGRIRRKRQRSAHAVAAVLGDVHCASARNARCVPHIARIQTSRTRSFAVTAAGREPSLKIL